jgi:hypothetical protein
MRKTNDKRRTNKSRLVLEHLKEYGSITSWEAIEKYGATRLSAIIYNIRKHHIVQSVDSSFTDRYGNESTFTKYIYCGEI